MWIPIRVEKFLETIITSLSEIKQVLQDNKASVDTAKISQHDDWSSVGRQIAEMRSDDEYKRGADTYKHKSYWQQVVLNILTGLLAAFTLGAFAAAGIYAYIASRQLDQMIESTEQAQRSADISTFAMMLNQAQFDAAMESNQKQFADTLAQMKVQSRAAADTAKATGQTLYMTNRANILAASPSLTISPKVLRVAIINTGRVQATGMSVEAYVLIAKDDGSKVDGHWTKDTYPRFDPTIIGGYPPFMSIGMNAMDPEEINKGTEGVIFGAVFKYNDGFPSTPQQTYTICYHTFVDYETHQMTWNPCDPETEIPKIKTAIDYPNNYKEPFR
jgi:ABC-type multidrug transport system fused ATPase/permease subunit